MKKRVLSLFLCLVMGLGLTSCTKQDEQTDVSPTPDASPSESVAPEAEPSDDAQETDVEEVRLAVLSGPTGVGAAKLLSANEDRACRNYYDVTVAADNSEVTAKLINGELDIAAVATNVAANLYNKTEGGVQLLCLSTLGVLYILEGGDEGFTPTVTSLGDLAGETVYAYGQGANPEYVLNYLLRENGLEPGTDVEIVWKTAEEVQTALLTGETRLIMLPVPAATAVLAQAKKAEDRDAYSVLDLTEEWNKVTEDSVLTMASVVVRTEFAQEHPDKVAAFLEDYQESITYVNNNVEDASALVEQFGIAPSAAIAKLAIPDCNLVYITGEEMRSQIQGYYEVLYAADPASIGGGIPDDGFYYGVE